MAPKPIIAVAGATGLQGGSVVSHLLQSGAFEVRGITRNAESTKAKELQARGVEVVAANMDDVESLRKAFKGSYGVYAVTNCWEHGWDAETRHGKNMVDAAKAEGVKHFVFSTMEHSGDLNVWHFESKAAVNDYLIESGLGRTLIYTAAYYENFTAQLKPNKAEDGSYTLDFNSIPPDTKFFAFSGGQIGAWVLQVFLHPEKYLNQDLKLVVEWLSVREMAETASRVTGLDVRARDCTLEDLERTREKGHIFEDLYRMSMYYVLNQPPTNVRNQEETLSIVPNATKWEDFVKDQAKVMFS